MGDDTPAQKIMKSGGFWHEAEKKEEEEKKKKKKSVINYNTDAGAWEGANPPASEQLKK